MFSYEKKVEEVEVDKIEEGTVSRVSLEWKHNLSFSRMLWVIAVAVIWFAAGFLHGYKHVQKSLREEAIANGCAYWDNHADGSPKFVWARKL